MDIMRTGTVILAVAGMGWIGYTTVSGVNETPRAAISTTIVVPPAAPSAYGCAVHCETDWHNGDIGATDHWFGTPIGPIGPPAAPPVVYLHVPAQVQVIEVPTVVGGSAPTVAKAGKAPKAAKAATSKASKAGSGPVTTVTDKTSTSTHITSKGASTTVTSSHTTQTRG